MEIDEKLLPQYNSAVRDELQNYLNELVPISPLAGGPSGRGAGSDPEIYLKPVETRDDFIARGLINEDGSPTDSGKRFDDLGIAGVIDANGLLTDKGRAYKLSDNELVRPENIEAYKIADSDGLFKKKDVPLSDYAYQALGGLWDAAKGAIELIPTVSPVYNAYISATGSQKELEKKINEDKVKIDTFIQDSTKSIMNASVFGLKLAGMASKESDQYAKIIDNLIPDSLKSPEMLDLADKRNKELNERYWQTKQRNQALTNIVEGYNNSKLVNDLGITTDLVLRAEEAKAALPQERVQEIQKTVGSFTSLVIDPLDIIPFSKAFSAGGVAKTAYSGQRAAGKLAEEMTRKSNAELAIATYEPLVLASQDAADLAFRKADGFSSVGSIERANTIRAFGEKMQSKADSLKPLLEQAGIDIQKSTRNIDRLSKFTDAPAILENMADVGRKSASVIADQVGKATEAIGSGLEKIDSGISGFISDTGVDQARKALNVIGLAKTGALFSGVPALQVAAGVISSGPILKAVGNFSRVMGQEALEKIGSVPFWQRVAANETVGPMGKALSHFFDSATTAGMFGGRAATDAIKGTAQLVPMMTAIGVVQNDGNLDANVIKSAVGQSVAFGGVGRAMGGMMIGSKRNIRVNQLGDEMNFRRRIEDPEQLSRFINLPAGIRRSIGTYSAAFPELKWDFRTEGGSYYTDNGVSSSVGININSTNPLKALVAHEVNHALLIKNGMEEAVASLLVGDGIQNGGIIRALDGTLDPSFEKFKTEYHARMERQARSNNQIYKPIDDRKMAVEYFVDSKADRMLEMAQSGQLGRIAGKSKMNAVLDSVISSIPIIKDLHMKMGGTYEANGKMVDGTGLATLIETPQGKKLFNDMLHDSAGWRRSNKLSKYNSEPSSTIFLDENDPMHKLLVSDYETDVNGVLILDKNKKPIPISRDTDQRREAGGFKIDEIQRNRVAAGENLEDGELRYNPSTKSWDGYFLSNAAIAQLEATDIFNRKQIEMLRSLNRTVQKGDGSRFQVLYNPATSRGRGGKVRYATRGVKLVEVVPVGIKVGAKGQILIEAMDTHQLAENIKQMASKSKAQKLNHTIQTIMNDAQEIMRSHATMDVKGKKKKSEPSDQYFKDKYGEKWEEYKGFANAVFGKMSAAHAEKNPTLNKVKPSRPVFKTYRLDRTNKVSSMSGDQMPFNYGKIVANYLPEGNPLLDKNGEVINIREEQQKAMDNAGKEQVRYMPEIAVVPERFTGSKGDIERRGKYVEPPNFFKKFNIESYERGGRFFDKDTGDDLTGRGYGMGSIDVSTGKPSLFVDGEAKTNPEGSKFKTNLFKQSAGWKWISENPPNTSTIVSVEGKGKHVYTLKANFENGVNLTRYSEKKSEPRLRPTAIGEMQTGTPIGTISIRGKEHPVYDSVGIVSKNATQPASSDIRYLPEADKKYLELAKDPERNKQELEKIINDEATTKIKRIVSQKTNTPLGGTFKVEAQGPLYRSVTQRDWDRIQEQGYLDSDQRYAVSKKEGINMATSPLSSITYAGKGDNSVLLKIDPSNINLHGYSGDQYVRTWDKIKLSDIEDIGKFIGGETKPSYIKDIQYDDAGNIIPPSQRFNPASSDIRYMPEADKKIKIAVNINDSGQKFTDQILNGEKTIETRPSINNALQSYLGQRVGIARTGVKNPQTGKADTKIVGYATIGKSPIHYTSEEAFRKDESKHLVKAGSKFDIKPNGEKFGYELTDIVRVNPFSPQSTNIKFSTIDTSKFDNKKKAPTKTAKVSKTKAETNSIANAVKMK
jgi:hypothetical protein